MVCLISIIPNICFTSNWLNFGGGTGIVWFIVLYCIGGYIRKFIVINQKSSIIFAKYLSIALLVPISRFLIANISYKRLGQIKNDGIFYSYNSVLVLGASVYLFLFFLSIKIRNIYFEKIILYFSSASFGIYLLHDNPYVRKLLWNYLNLHKYAEERYFVLILIIVVMFVFGLGTVIEKMRKKFMHIYDNRLSIKIAKKIEVIITYIVVKKEI